MIKYFTPYSIEKNLGKAYNHYAALVTDPEDWMCFKDGDVFFLTPDYGVIINEMIERFPNAGLMSCLTNRVGTLTQCYGSRISEDTNILSHYDIAVKCKTEKRHSVIQTSNVISGHVMIIQKKTWTLIGGAMDGLLGVDNDISRKVLKAGKKIMILEGLYCFHFYRFKNGIKDKKHLDVNPMDFEQMK